MKEVNYRKLRDNYKKMFDMCAFTKTDHKDLNNFKLYFNDKLLEVFLKDQASKVFRGLSGYAQLKADLHEELEKEYFRKKDNSLSITSILNAIDEGNFISFDFIQADDKNKYNFLNIKIIISTLDLNEAEKTFLAANIGTTFDDESSSATLAIANLHRQRKDLNMEKLEIWAKNVGKSHLEDHYRQIDTEYQNKKTMKLKLEQVFLDLYAKHLI